MELSTRGARKAAFVEFYNGPIRRVLADLDLDREAALAQSNRMIWITAGAGGFLFLWLGLHMLFAIISGVSLAAAAIRRYYQHDYRARFKVEVMQELIRFLDPSLSYHPILGVDDRVFYEAGWFPSRRDDNTAISKEDLIEGRLGGFPCQFSEFKARTTDDGEDNTTVFHGLLFQLTLPGPVPVHTIIEPEQGKLMAKLEAFLKGKGLKPISMDDPDFEKAYTVFSSDSIQANYLLTNNLLEVLAQFHAKVKAPVFVTFQGNTVTVGINSFKSYFEPPLTKSLLSATLMYDYFRDLELFVDLVDCLNLQEKFWLQVPQRQAPVVFPTVYQR
jgi:Protein of unknown function (DUF3137)